MSKVNTDKLKQGMIEARADKYSKILCQAYSKNRNKILQAAAEAEVLPIIAKYAQQEIVDKPWKVEGESHFRRYAVIVSGRFVGVKTLGDQRLEKRKHLNFADGFKIDMNDGGYIIHDWNLPQSASIYNSAWDPSKFEQYLLEGNIFAPPDYNPFGRYEWLTNEEYEAYKNGPASENRYPARDFYEMAFEEIHSDEVQRRLANQIVSEILKYIKPE